LPMRLVVPEAAKTEAAELTLVAEPPMLPTLWAPVPAKETVPVLVIEEAWTLPAPEMATVEETLLRPPERVRLVPAVGEMWVLERVLTVAAMMWEAAPPVTAIEPEPEETWMLMAGEAAAPMV